MTSAERMSPSDSAFWHLESDVSRMHAVTLAIMSGPAPAAAELAEHLAHRVPLVPRLRQRVVPVPFDLERPVWVDDPGFDLDDHLVVTSNPLGMAGLSELVSLIVSVPLDRDRPLWNLTLVTDLPDDQWALVSKVHHSMIDGVSGTDLLGVLVDGTVHVKAAASTGNRGKQMRLLSFLVGLAGLFMAGAARRPDAAGRDPARGGAAHSVAPPALEPGEYLESRSVDRRPGGDPAAPDVAPNHVERIKDADPPGLL